MGSGKVNLERVLAETTAWEETRKNRDPKVELNDMIEKYGFEATMIATGLSIQSIAAYSGNGNSKVSLDRLDRAKTILSKCGV